jgi:hypothetical protein
MPTILTEETRAGKETLKLTFEFSDKWQVCKYDEEKFYNKLRGQGLKGVDFIVLSENSILFMEVKYIVKSNEESTMRFSSNADNEKIELIKDKLTIEENNFICINSKRPYLVDEVVKKVKDTILGLLASYRENSKELSDYSQSIFMCSKKPILVLLFLERNEELNQEQIFKPQASNLQLAIAQRLNFLGNVQVAVVNSLTLPASLEIKVLENTRTSTSK